MKIAKIERAKQTTCSYAVRIYPDGSFNEPTHVWPPDHANGDTCVCGHYYAITRQDGVFTVAKNVKPRG